MRNYLLQLNFIILALINLSFRFCFLFSLKRLLLYCIGIKTGKQTAIHGIKIFALGKMKIGRNCSINSGVYLDNRRRITIGNNVNISHDSKIYTLGHDYNSPDFATKGKEVIIEDNVVIFSNVLIMPGVTIHEGAVVLPGAVVTKDVEEFSVVGGNPARFINHRQKNISYSLDYRYWFAL
ncbi:acyltransferase [Treponema zuelzerae]|uniref:Acyltransferase n=1 Tax=Teretinema zuelzerae TaxID=156 RepID=A0AAE3JHN2_9SPIR|nr:acyltransferase [Teretinema zuelzerae]MCD1653158.1 acyltransferase [Teretinema zuelzerae]